MPSSPPAHAQNGKTPCRLCTDEWPVCYEDHCYQNYCCPVYRGKHPSPVRDYIPLPPVFILVGPYQSIPFAYQIQVLDPESEV